MTFWRGKVTVISPEMVFPPSMRLMVSRETPHFCQSTYMLSRAASCALLHDHHVGAAGGGYGWDAAEICYLLKVQRHLD